MEEEGRLEVGGEGENKGGLNKQGGKKNAKEWDHQRETVDLDHIIEATHEIRAGQALEGGHFQDPDQAH